MKQDTEYAVPLFKAGAEWRINSVWHDAREKPDCYRFIVFLPKKSTIGLKNPIMGVLQEDQIFISSRPGCILYRFSETIQWAYLNDLLGLMEGWIMENQVLSIDQMQRLKELGVNTSKSNIYWVRRSHGSRINDSSKGNWFLSLQKEFMGVGFTAHEVIPTFTLQDIIDILPGSIDNNVLTIRKHVNGVSISYEDTYTRSILSIFEKEDIIEAAYEMLVWCVKNGYVKNK